MADEHATDHTIRAAEDISEAAATTLVGPTRPNEIDLPGRSVELPPRPVEDGPTGAPPGPGRPVTVVLDLGHGLARGVVTPGADRWHRAVDPAVAQIAGAHDVD